MTPGWAFLAVDLQPRSPMGGRNARSGVLLATQTIDRGPRGDTVGRPPHRPANTASGKRFLTTSCSERSVRPLNSRPTRSRCHAHTSLACCSHSSETLSPDRNTAKSGFLWRWSRLSVCGVSFFHSPRESPCSWLASPFCPFHLGKARVYCLLSCSRSPCIGNCVPATWGLADSSGP
jgi:hypothetical protein